MSDEQDLRAQLSAAQRTIEALSERIEFFQASNAAQDRHTILQAIVHLEAIVEQRTRDLAASEDRYRSLFDVSPDLLVTVDNHGAITSTNATLRRALSREDQLVGMPLSSLFESESAHTVRTQLQAVLDRDEEIELRLRDGRTVTCTGAQVDEPSGGYLVVIRDVTTRRRLEDALQSARRLAALGHLAAGVAHEINNPLAVIQGHAELALMSSPPPSQAHSEAFQLVIAHAERIGRIVRNLRAFSGPERAVREPLHLASLLDSAVSGARGLADASVEVRPPDLRVVVDRWQIERVFANLLQNAVDAKDTAPTVRITATQAGDRVAITFADDGPGIPPDLLDDVLNPFVGSRTNSARPGLGLSICWAVLQDHSSTLQLDNPPEGGARFHFSLPLGDRAATPALDTVEATSLPTGRVLIVEDEASLAKNIQTLLRAAGLETEIASSAEQALTMLERPWDCLLADIRLPGLSGVELLERVRVLRPKLAERVVLMSGLFQAAPEGVQYLQKPFRGPQLMAAVKRATQPR